MWNGSQETWVDSLKRHLKAWKLRGPAGDGSKGAWSDETICDFIIEAHERIGGPAKTGVVFIQQGAGDESKRKKANAARIMRYITDEPTTDDQAEALINMLPSISAAMPRDLAISFWIEYMAPFDMMPQGLDCGVDGEFTITDLSKVIKEDAEAHQACAAVIASADIAALTAARKSLRKSIAEKLRAARVVDAMCKAKSATGCAIKKMFKRDKTFS